MCLYRVETFFGGDTYMTSITDEFIRQMLSTTRQYCIVILKAGPNRNEDGVEKIIWADNSDKEY